MSEKGKRRWLPYLLSLSVIILDQVSKAWIVSAIPEGSVGYTFLGDFLWIVHVRNNAVAFSLGATLPVIVKYIFFIGLPLLLMVALSWAISSRRLDSELSSLQRWCLAGILGGGMGNLVDRIFRNLRVVDWISVRFYGLFGMERFPTWNIGDASVVVSVFLLLITFIVDESRNKKDVR